MKKIFVGLICGGLAVSGLTAPVAALEAADCSEDIRSTDCEAYVEDFEEKWQNGELYRDRTIETGVEPTFVGSVDEAKEFASLWMGKNLLVAGNNIATDLTASTGLMFIAGNTLNLSTAAEYGFVAGNVINFAGATARDAYFAGNMVTLEPNAHIGRDVFAAASSLTVKSDLKGSLAASAGSVVFKDVKIAGNVDLNASEVRFEGNVTVAGTLTYNDSAVVSGLNSNGVQIGKTESYHVEEVSDSALLVTAIYGKLLSIAGLFLAMALVLALSSKLHEKAAQNATAASFGKNLALGLAVLVGVPIFAIMALCTVVAAPIALVVLALYLVMIYLSQGFAGLWLGHILIEKVIKAKSNAYLEALIGIVILGLLSLVPYIGAITGLLGLLFGLGFIVSSVKPGNKGQEITEAKDTKVRKQVAKSTKTSATKTTKAAKKPAAKKSTAKSKSTRS